MAATASSIRLLLSRFCAATTNGRCLTAASQIVKNAPIRATSVRYLSITYSGGQAIDGQGGFYASGGARANAPDEVQSDRSRMLALAADVQHIQDVMKELDILESLLRSEEGQGVTSKSMELKNSIKKLMTAPDVSEALNRLEVQGEPVWGLSSEERELIILAREKANEC